MQLMTNHWARLDYGQLANFLSKNVKQLPRKQGIAKEELKQLLTITQSDRERKCIRYAIYKTSGATPTKAHCIFGFQNMKTRAAHVETCIKEAQEIYEAVESLVQNQDRALLESLGIESSSDENSDKDCSDSCDTTDKNIPDYSSLATILCESKYNWFQFVERMEEDGDLDNPCLWEVFLSNSILRI